MMSDKTPALAQAGEISEMERVVSTVAGLGLAALAVKPRPNHLLSALALAVGAFLAYRGATGHCPIRAAIGG